jgi:hypothetical protein
VTTDSPESCNIGLTKHVIEWTSGGSWIAECPRDGSLGVHQDRRGAVEAIAAHLGFPADAEEN